MELITRIKRIEHEDGIYYLLLDKKDFEFKVGQFVKLEYNGIVRAYSIASNKELEFCIRDVGGAFTSNLKNMKVGDEIKVIGPYGHFVYEGEKKALFFAAGTGIAPIRAIIQEINEKDIKGEFYLFYTAKRMPMPYYKELNEQKKVKVIFVLTEEERKGFEHKRIDQEMVNKYVKDPKEFVGFICGPLGFARAMKDIVGNAKIEAWG